MAVKTYPLANVAVAMRMSEAAAASEVDLCGVKVHTRAGARSISRAGLLRLAQVNFPQAGRARAAFIDRVANERSA